MEYSIGERQDCIDEIKRLLALEKDHMRSFYDLELYDDLALEEMKARDMGIDELEFL